MWNDLTPAYRFPVLILGMLSLVVGILAGIGRLGVMMPPFALNQMTYHGVLMVPAFFGTVIGLERAVAIGQRWAYIAPLLSGIGGGMLITGASPAAALLLLLLGSVIFFLASLQVIKIQNAIHNWILVAGALCLVIGNVLLYNAHPFNTVMLWWMTFLLLTITGERLELSRLAIQGNNKRLLLAILCLLPVLGALLISTVDATPGIVIFSLGLGTIAVWLLLFDIARRTVWLSGLTRFTAACMLTGYFWLLMSALLLTGFELGWEYFSRDSALHSFFLGFVFSMVIGHALLIFPAVTRLKIPYSPALYLPLLVLQISLLLRVIAGILADSTLLMQAGIGNGIALALFILTLVWRIAIGFRRKGIAGTDPASSAGG